MKYHNKKIIIDGIPFPSRKEGYRYLELKNMRDRGEITDLKLQVPYILIPAFNLGKKRYRKMEYIADFVYKKNGVEIVEDTKGYKTKEYNIKKKLMAYIYQIEIKES